MTARNFPPLNARQRAALNVLTGTMTVREISEAMGRVLRQRVGWDQAYSALLGLENRALAIRISSKKPARYRLTNSGLAKTARI